MHAISDKDMVAGREPCPTGQTEPTEIWFSFYPATTASSRRGRPKQSGTLAFLTCIVNEPRKSIHSLAGGSVGAVACLVFPSPYFTPLARRFVYRALPCNPLPPPPRPVQQTGCVEKNRYRSTVTLVSLALSRTLGIILELITGMKMRLRGSTKRSVYTSDVFVARNLFPRVISDRRAEFTGSTMGEPRIAR